MIHWMLATIARPSYTERNSVSSSNGVRDVVVRLVSCGLDSDEDE